MTLCLLAAAEGHAEENWLLQAPAPEAVDAPRGRYRLAAGGSTCDAIVRCTGKHSATVVDSPADNRGKPLGWRQLRVTAETDAVRFASLYTPWGGKPSMGELAWTPDGAAFVVDGKSGEDRWTWTAAADEARPAALTLTCGGAVLLTVGVSDKPAK